MTIADIIALAAVLVFAIIGLIVGFGKGLKFFTSGIFGFIFSIIVCWFIFDYVLNIGFVADLLTKLDNAIINGLEEGSTFYKLFVEILPTSKIVLAIVLFILVQIVRIIIVAIIKGIFEINNVVFRFFNKLFGVILFVGILLMLVLLVFNYLPAMQSVFPDFIAKVQSAIEDSAFLNWLYESNPLVSVLPAI